MKVAAEMMLKNPTRDELEDEALALVEVAYMPDGVERDVDYHYHLVVVRTPQQKQSNLAPVRMGGHG